MLQMQKNIRNYYRVSYNEAFVSLINFVPSQEMEVYIGDER